MKKFLAVVSLSLIVAQSAHAFNLFADTNTPAAKLREFVKMETSHKTDWINFCHKFQDKMTSLLNHVHSAKKDLKLMEVNDWSKHVLNSIDNWDAIKNINDKNAIEHKELISAIELLEKEKPQYKEKMTKLVTDTIALLQSYGQGAGKLAEKHDQELASFKNSLMSKRPVEVIVEKK